MRLIPVLVVGAALVAGCSHDASVGELQRANQAGASAQALIAASQAAASASAGAAAAQASAQASLAAEVDKLKSAAASPPPAPSPTAAPAPKTTTTSCGDNVSAGGSTSCSFAQNVAEEWRYYGQGTSNITAYSPVTEEYITMHCVAGVPVVCKGGRAAVVYIR